MFGTLSDGEKYLYHYTSSEKLAMILLNGSLRLGPYSATRDPRENKTWSLPLHSSEEFAQEIDAAAIWNGLDAAVRQRAKLTCFTMDIPTDDVWPHSLRGWGRARMWEQYADRHRGAVLLFDHVKLTELMQRRFHNDRLLHGEVLYATGQWSTSLIRRGIDAVDVLNRGVEEVAKDLIESAGAELFFQKDLDWSGEAEYRYLVVSEAEAEFVEINEAIAGIALGADYPAHELSVLRYRLTQAACPDVPVARIMWMNGYPMAVPGLPA